MLNGRKSYNNDVSFASRRCFHGNSALFCSVLLLFVLFECLNVNATYWFEHESRVINTKLLPFVTSRKLKHEE